MTSLLNFLLNAGQVLSTLGMAGVFIFIFAESGLFIGFFLPGDSLLFTAGFLASQGFFDIYILLLAAFSAAVMGDSVGYSFGRIMGPKIFKKDDSLIFKKDYLERTKKFYSEHGKKTVVLARFMPVIRTFAPILAGVGRMNYQTFISYNFIGAFFWALGIPLAGFFLGKEIPHADHYLIPIIILIIIISIIPPLREFKKSGRKNYG